MPNDPTEEVIERPFDLNAADADDERVDVAAIRREATIQKWCDAI